MINKAKLYSSKIEFLLTKVFLLLLTVILSYSCSYSEDQTVANFNSLVMADEFNTDGAPDSSIWNYEIGTGIKVIYVNLK